MSHRSPLRGTSRKNRAAEALAGFHGDMGFRPVSPLILGPGLTDWQNDPGTERAPDYLSSVRGLCDTGYSMSRPDQRATAQTRARYRQIGPFCDAIESLVEWRYRPWRQARWALARGPKVLKAGVGTGKNHALLSSGPRGACGGSDTEMLERARKRAEALGLAVELRLGDAQALEYPHGTFDTVIATFVFCSVPSPAAGLREPGRVVRFDGRVLLLEDVRPAAPWLGRLRDLANPVVVRMVGANINRRTVENVRRAGLTVESVRDFGRAGISRVDRGAPRR